MKIEYWTFDKKHRMYEFYLSLNWYGITFAICIADYDLGFHFGKLLSLSEEDN